MSYNPITDLLPASTDPSSLEGRYIPLFDSSGNDMALDGNTLKNGLDKTGKADKVGTGHEDKVASFDSNGNLKDSGVDVDSLAMRDEDAVEGNLAMLDENGNPVDSGVPASKIGEIDERVKVLRNHDGIAEGIADTLSAGTPQQFTFRQSGGDGVNYMRRILGKTLAWNQLAVRTDSQSEAYGITRTANGDALHYSGTSTNSDNFTGTQWVNLQASHKYYYAGIGIPATCGISQITGPSVIGVNSAIYQPLQDEQRAFGVYVPSGVSINNDVFFVCVDLTQMFGAGNEPSTVAEFEALYPGFTAFDSGSLISNDAAAVKTVGFNLWDEEWERGGIDTTTGQNVPNTGYIRTKNYIKVIPGSHMYLRYPNGTTGPFVLYDAAKNYIGVIGSGSTLNKIVQIPDNCCYIRSNFDGTTYNHDICINLSDPAKNGTYEPYWERTLQLGLSTLTGKLNGQGASVVVFPDGMNGVGIDRDAIRADGKTADKARARVDLGSLNWSYYNGFFYTNFFDNILTTMSVNYMCVKYVAVSPYGSGWTDGDKVMRFTSGNGAFNIKDSDYTDPAAFKASLNGVYLDYPLATTETYVLDEPLPNAILVDALGTEQAIFPEHEDGTPSAPFCCDSNYSISVKKLLNILNDLTTS